MNRSASRPMLPTPAILAAVAVGLLALLVPQLAAGAKPKDGGYVQKPDKRGVYGYVGTFDGKIVSGGGAVTFRANGGGKCRSDLIKPYTNKGVTSLGAAPRKPAKVRKSKFGFTDSTSLSGFKTTISGKFKSKKKAVIKITSKVKGCTAQAKFRKAKYQSGG